MPQGAGVTGSLLP